MEEHKSHSEHAPADNKEHVPHSVHPAHHASHPRKPTFAPIHTILAVLIGVVLLVNMMQISGINSTISGEEPPKPEIKVTLLTADCEDCFDMTPIFDQLIAAKEFEIEHDTLAMTDVHAKKLMAANNITKLPAIVIEGDVETLKLEGFVKSNEALLFQAVAPYYDVTSASLKGSVDIAFITADSKLCPTCEKEPWLGESLTNAGVLVLSEKDVAATSTEGKRLIDAYSITKLPTYVLSSGIGEYEQIALAWSQYGDVAEDGSYVMRTISSPYYDLSTKKVRGEVKMMGLIDATCKECYNISIHEEIFESNFGITFAAVKLYDVASTEGKNLLKQYNITKVPTIIVTGDVEAHPTLKQAWPQVGVVAPDGAYVFHKVEVLQGLTYKDLATGKIVKAVA